MTGLAATSTEWLWAGSGALVTLLLGSALLYWINQEWRALDRGKPPSSQSRVAPSAPDADRADETRGSA